MAFATLTWTSTVTWTRFEILQRIFVCLYKIYFLQAIKIVLDAKTDYPAACNAMETLLVHESLMTNDTFHHVSAIMSLFFCE